MFLKDNTENFSREEIDKIYGKYYDDNEEIRPLSFFYSTHITRSLFILSPCFCTWQCCWLQTLIIAIVSGWIILIPGFFVSPFILLLFLPLALIELMGVIIGFIVVTYLLYKASANAHKNWVEERKGEGKEQARSPANNYFYVLQTCNICCSGCCFIFLIISPIFFEFLPALPFCFCSLCCGCLFFVFCFVGLLLFGKDIFYYKVLVKRGGIKKIRKDFVGWDKIRKKRRKELKKKFMEGATYSSTSSSEEESEEEEKTEKIEIEDVEVKEDSEEEEESSPSEKSEEEGKEEVKKKKENESSSDNNNESNESSSGSESSD